MTTFLARLKATEPAKLAEFARAILAALVAVGWVTLDEQAIAAVVSVVALVGSWALTAFTRRRVTPLADPKAEDGTPLEPIPGARP